MGGRMLLLESNARLLWEGLWSWLQTGGGKYDGVGGTLGKGEINASHSPAAAASRSGQPSSRVKNAPAAAGEWTFATA